MNEYNILMNTNIYELQQAVVHLLNHGWLPAGGVNTDRSNGNVLTFYQAMYRTTRSKGGSA